HFGSRGFGHKTASGFLALAQGLDIEERARGGAMDSPPVLFPADSELGQAYVGAMELAGEYAYAGRDVVVGKVLEILGCEAVHEDRRGPEGLGARAGEAGARRLVGRAGAAPRAGDRARRWRGGRGAGGLQAPPGRARRPRRLDPRQAQVAPARSRDGRRRRL